ncbi:MAG: potassium channel family protein [Mycobacterium sp.]
MIPQSRLERYERRTEWPLAAVALLFLGLYSVRVLGQPRGVAFIAVHIALFTVYLAFVIDYGARLYLAQPRGRWFIRHLWELPIIVLPFFRPLRLLSLAAVVKTLEHAVGDTIRGRVVLYTAVGAVSIVYASSLAILDAERGQPHANINTFGDALWWAMTTVTTVGYGDLTPVTGTGRIVAVALMIGGITLLGTVTATLASWIVQRVSEEDTASHTATAVEIDALREEIRRLAESVNIERRHAVGDRMEGEQ